VKVYILQKKRGFKLKNYSYDSGWGFTKLLTQIHKILGLKCSDYLGLKYFLKQISLKGDFNYCINHKVPIFYE